MSYLKNYLDLNLDDYVDIISLKQFPYWTQQEYPVPDNWWHSKEYYNVPLNVFMDIIKTAIKNGYSMAIGGDVTEPGFDHVTQCAIIPTFDIPPQYIDENARQFRFTNHTTTDDHGMHLVGYTQYKGWWWFLIKDSSSGSRWGDPKSPNFGYYFFREDYIKLKMMDIMINKNAIPKQYREKMGL
jgi:bleomycin hydrolase